jgi:hypothetical protein
VSLGHAQSRQVYFYPGWQAGWFAVGMPALNDDSLIPFDDGRLIDKDLIFFTERLRFTKSMSAWVRL